MVMFNDIKDIYLKKNIIMVVFKSSGVFIYLHVRNISLLRWQKWLFIEMYF